MIQRTIRVLNPVANMVAKQAPVSTRMSNFNGKTAGILWNGKPNGDLLLARILELLKTRFNLAGHLWLQKSKFDVADPAVIKELASKTDFIIVGPGDWGSCTSWSIRDSIELERLNKPTVTVCTELFRSMADVIRKSTGMPELPLVIVSHPIGGLKKEEVIAKADAIIEQIINSLTITKTNY